MRKAVTDCWEGGDDLTLPSLEGLGGSVAQGVRKEGVVRRPDGARLLLGPPRGE